MGEPDELPPPYLKGLGVKRITPFLRHPPGLRTSAMAGSKGVKSELGVSGTSAVPPKESGGGVEPCSSVVKMR